MIQQFHSRYTYEKKNKNTNSKIYMDSNIYTTLFTKTKIWKQSKCPAAYELIKINYTHTHTHTQNGIPLTYRKE